MGNETIIIEVEEMETVFGKTARFWQGKSMVRQVGLNVVLETMNELTAYYNNTCNKAVMFTVV